MDPEEDTRPQRQRLEKSSHKPRTTGSHQKLKEAGTDSPVETSGGVQPCPHPESGLVASRTVRW